MIQNIWAWVSNWFLSDYLVKVQDGSTRARIRMVFNFAWFYLILGILPVVQFALEGRIFQLMYSSGAVLLFLSVPFLLKYTQRLEVGALIFGFGGVIQLAVTEYFSHGELSYITAIWGIINVLFIYFTLERFWGSVFLGLFGLHIIIFSALRAIDYPFKTGSLPPMTHHSVFEKLIPLAFLVYLILEYLRQESRAREELQFSIAMETSLNNELEEQLVKLSERETELEGAKEKAEKLARSRTDFLSNMSHEIRTPMNGVVGIANVLLEETPKPEQRENLEALKFSAENLLYLIDNILDFNKLESGKMALDSRPVQLAQLMQRCLALWEANARHKNLKLVLDASDNLPDWISADPFKLTQMLNNLLNNAIRFTDKGGVTLSAELVEQKDEVAHLMLSVKDTGVGIPEEELEQIFDTFFQARNNEQHARGGSGLGLAIVKKLTTLMNATLTVESKSGEGTCFRLVIPFTITDRPRHQQANTKAADILADRHILLVEDNATNRLVARKILSRWRVAVEEAENGQIAIGKLSRFPMYDAILLDLQMPVMDGYATAEWIRKQKEEYFRTVPIIALTAAALSEVREKILDLGVDGFITKPFDPQDLRDKLTRVLSQDTDS